MKINGYQLHTSDALSTLKTMQDNSVHSIVTDPPYGLSFMGKRWDYDVPSVEIWAECLRVLKPGGYLLAFAGTRTQHRMAVRIEDAGFEIRDMIAWVYGSGFPKNHDISKGIDKQAGAEREVVGVKKHSASQNIDTFKNSGDYILTTPATDEAKKYAGWGTALKPALEPITVARKPFSGTVADNVLKYGTGGLNIDGCRIETEDKLGGGMVSKGRPKVSEGWDRPWMHNKEVTDKKKIESADKVSHAENLGRWPANFIHDGSEDVTELFPNSKAGGGHTGKAPSAKTNTAYGEYAERKPFEGYADAGSAARFFYCAKASKSERNAGAVNAHPTVKPLTLMRYLCRLVTPPDGIILDPFNGSGTTGCAAILEDFNYIGIDKEAEYIAISKARIDHYEVEKLLA